MIAACILVMIACGAMDVGHEMASVAPPRSVNTIGLQLKAAGVDLPALQDAVLDRTEIVELGDGAQGLLCRLKNDQGTAGYVLLAGPDYSNLLALSLSPEAPPMEWFVGKDSPGAALPLQFFGTYSFAAGASLVATGNADIAGTETRLTEATCSIATLLLYMQHGCGAPLFGYPGFGYSHRYLPGGLTFAGWFCSLKTHAAHAEHCPNEQHSERPAGWTAYLKDMKEIYGTDPLNLCPVNLEEAQLLWQRHRTASGIRKRHLMSDIAPWERLAILSHEMAAITRITPATNNTPGIRCALLLQESYLGENETLDEDIREFFLTRGLNVDIKISRLDDLTTPALGLLRRNGDVQGVLLGMWEIDAAMFAIVFLPRHGTIARTSLQDRAGKIASPPKSEDPRVKAMLARTLARMDEVTAHDVISSFPASLDCGVHIIRVSSLQEWEVIAIGDISPAR